MIDWYERGREIAREHNASGVPTAPTELTTTVIKRYGEAGVAHAYEIGVGYVLTRDAEGMVDAPAPKRTSDVAAALSEALATLLVPNGDRERVQSMVDDANVAARCRR